MNSILFDNDAPFLLKHNDSKLEHIKTVLKAKDGDEIFAGKINDKLYICKYQILENGDAILVPIKETNNPSLSNTSIAVSFARPQIAQRILFESACFGVKNLIFYPASKGEGDYAKSKLYTSNEYINWLEKGAMQACSTFIPNFHIANSLKNAVDILDSLNDEDSIKIAPDVYEATTSLSVVKQNINDKQIVAILGSERGFNSDDRNLLRNNGYTLVSLGDRVLRTDSAIIATLAILSA